MCFDRNLSSGKGLSMTLCNAQNGPIRLTRRNVLRLAAATAATATVGSPVPGLRANPYDSVVGQLVGEQGLSPDKSPSPPRTNSHKQNPAYAKPIAFEGRWAHSHNAGTPDIVAGGELYFRMGHKPNKEWASAKADRPPSGLIL